MILLEEYLQQLSEIKGSITLHDKQILDDHRIFHAWWSYINKTNKPMTDRSSGKKIDRKEIIKRHTIIVKYLISNGFTHRRVSTLDDTLPSYLKKKTLQKDK